MQLVPYVPIHPAQLYNKNNTNTTSNNNNNTTIDTKTKESTEDQTTSDKDKSQTSSNENKSQTNDRIFKIPLVPTPYTVEEPPCDDTIKRGSTMKR